MCSLYGFDSDDYWGLITFSGTDGNNHGLYFGTNEKLDAYAESVSVVTYYVSYVVGAVVRNREWSYFKCADAECFVVCDSPFVSGLHFFSNTVVLCYSSMNRLCGIDRQKPVG